MRTRRQRKTRTAAPAQASHTDSTSHTATSGGCGTSASDTPSAPASTRKRKRKQTSRGTRKRNTRRTAEEESGSEEQVSPAQSAPSASDDGARAQPAGRPSKRRKPLSGAGEGIDMAGALPMDFLDDVEQTAPKIRADAERKAMREELARLQRREAKRAARLKRKLQRRAARTRARRVGPVRVVLSRDGVHPATRARHAGATAFANKRTNRVARGRDVSLQKELAKGNKQKKSKKQSLLDKFTAELRAQRKERARADEASVAPPLASLLARQQRYDAGW